MCVCVRARARAEHTCRRLWSLGKLRSGDFKQRLTRRGLKRRRLRCTERESNQSTNLEQCRVFTFTKIQYFMLGHHTNIDVDEALRKGSNTI